MMATTRIRKRHPPAPPPKALMLNCGGTFDSQMTGWSLQTASINCCCAKVALAEAASAEAAKLYHGMNTEMNTRNEAIPATRSPRRDLLKSNGGRVPASAAVLASDCGILPAGAIASSCGDGCTSAGGQAPACERSSGPG